VATPVSCSQPGTKANPIALPVKFPKIAIPQKSKNKIMCFIYSPFLFPRKFLDNAYSTALFLTSSALSFAEYCSQRHRSNDYYSENYHPEFTTISVFF
jgi:hypothetical protein